MRQTTTASCIVSYAMHGGVMVYALFGGGYSTFMADLERVDRFTAMSRPAVSHRSCFIVPLPFQIFFLQTEGCSTLAC